MKKLLKRYWRLIETVQRAHEERKMANGHDFDHAFSVANLAFKFCETDEFKELAWIAGLYHNADRIIACDRKSPRLKVPPEGIETLVQEWLAFGRFSESAKLIVIGAVLSHNEPNSDSDDAVTIALKDADRVVCSRIDVVVRAGQFHPDIPVLDPHLLFDDKRGSFTERLSVMASLRDCLDWGNLEDKRFGVRTEKAKKMIVARTEMLRSFLLAIIEQRREEGLVPYPV